MVLWKSPVEEMALLERGSPKAQELVLDNSPSKGFQGSAQSRRRICTRHCRDGNPHYLCHWTTKGQLKWQHKVWLILFKSSYIRVATHKGWAWTPQDAFSALGPKSWFRNKQPRKPSWVTLRERAMNVGSLDSFLSSADHRQSLIPRYRQPSEFTKWGHPFLWHSCSASWAQVLPGLWTNGGPNAH